MAESKVKMNPPLSDAEVRVKLADKTLTFREALEYSHANATTSNAKTLIKNIYNTGLGQMGISPDQPWSDFQKRSVFEKMHTSDAHPEVKADRYINFQALEKVLTVSPYAEVEDQMYPLKVMTSGESKKVTGKGQARYKSQMRGVVSNKEWNKIYEDAFRDKDGKLLITNAEHRNALMFHKITGGRPENLFSKGGNFPLTADDFIYEIDVDTGEEVIVMTANRNVNKGRAAIQFSGEDKAWVESLIKEAETRPNRNIFQISNTEYSKVFKEHITPQIEKRPKVIAKVPMLQGKPMVTPAVVRHVTNKIMTDELRVPLDYTNGFMGHAPQDIGRGSYLGEVPPNILGEVKDAFIEDSAYQGGHANTRSFWTKFGIDIPTTLVDDEGVEYEVNTTPVQGRYRWGETARGDQKPRAELTAAQRKAIDDQAKADSAIAEASVETAKKTGAQARLERLDAEIEEMERVSDPAYLEKYKKYQEAILKKAEIEKQVADELAAEKKAAKALTPEREKEITKSFFDMFTSPAGKKLVSGAVTVGGTALIGASLAPRIAEAQAKIEAGEPVIPSVSEEAGQFLLEEGPVGAIQGALEVGQEVVGAALEPVLEEYETQAEEAGLDEDTESQAFRLFGEQQFQ